MLNASKSYKLALPQLPLAARLGNILPKLIYSSLILIGVQCDAGYTATFNKKGGNQVKGNTILVGKRDTSMGLWWLPLTNSDKGKQNTAVCPTQQ